MSAARRGEEPREAGPDQLPGARHPAATPVVHGQDGAVARLADALAAGRLPHGLLLTGPEGVGKATLAYAVARRLLAGGGPAGSLAVAPDHPVVPLVAQGTHPDLAVVRRGPNKDGKGHRGEIMVDDVRVALHRLSQTAAAGGARVVIVDRADELNRHAANALLKALEEPPRGVSFVLVAHRPGALLPTIRSRCQVVRLEPLDETALRRIAQEQGVPTERLAPALAEAEGSARRLLAAALRPPGGLVDELRAALADPARLDGRAAQTLAERCAGRMGDDAFALLCDEAERLLQARVRRLARSAAELEAMAEVAEFQRDWQARVRAAEALNLDRRPLVLALLAGLAALPA